MVIRGKGAQPTDARPWVQAAAWVLLCGAAPLLAGCSSVPASINPVSWWHNMEGGAIAKQRPPPPGANEAYPNLATVPAKPEPPDQKAMEAITQGLVADRAHAEYMAAAAPLPDPSSPAASPALFGQGTLPPPPPASASSTSASAAGGPAPVASASLPAVTAPPAPSGPPPAPSPAPRRPVESTPLAPLASAAPPAQMATAGPTPGAAAAGASPGNSPPPASPGTATPPPSPANATAAPPPVAPASVAAAPSRNAPSAPPGAAATQQTASALSPATPAPNPNAPLAPPGAAVTPPAASAPPPPIPTAPPAPPRLSGPGAPAVAMASASPPLAPAPQAANAITVEFVTGSTALPPGAADVLKGVAAQRGKAVVAVTGYGDATSSDPDAQSAALSLGLSRAQAVANALTADGVPATAVRVGAEAGGRGASVRLVQ
jgi:outer membrane protein OmpA-like peptidoglycan-associated protein